MIGHVTVPEGVHCQLADSRGVAQQCFPFFIIYLARENLEFSMRMAHKEVNPNTYVTTYFVFLDPKLKGGIVVLLCCKVGKQS